MILSLGYIKDLLAFIFSIIYIIIFIVFKIKKKIIILDFLVACIFIFDGIFTFLPYLHNYVIIS